MYKFDRVKLSSLRQCPARVTLQTEKHFSDLVDVAKSHPERIAPIAVAVHGKVQYIADGHLRARALGRAGHLEIPAQIYTVRGAPEVVRLHIELNTHGSVNPLGMVDAARFLKKHGAEKFVPKAYLELASKTLYPKVREKVDLFVKDAQKKYSTLALPVHVIAWLVGFEKEEDQSLAATVLLDSLANVKESRFFFPTPTDLELMAHQLRPNPDVQKEAVIYEPAKGTKGMKKMPRAEAEGLVRGSSYDSIVRCPCGEKLLLDARTHRVSTVRDDTRNRCIRLREGGNARSVYAIPDAMLDFLEMRSGGELQVLRIGSRADLEKLASKARDKVRMLVVLAR